MLVNDIQNLLLADWFLCCCRDQKINLHVIEEESEADEVS